jgi:carbon storage regulator
MLVIGREVGEVITIGDDIRIMVVETRDGMVRFGVSAPRECARGVAREGVSRAARVAHHVWPGAGIAGFPGRTG